jgi:DNA polymerase III delta subunit
MTLVELKNYITTGQVPTEFLIFIRKDNYFLAKQYIDEIIKLSPDGVNRIGSVYEPLQSSLSLLTSDTEVINILYTETFDEIAENYGQFINTIVVCDQVDKSIKDVVEKYTVVFPKLEEWQIFDYAKTLCKNVDDQDLTTLIKLVGSDIELLIREIAKVSIFTKDEQKAIFSAVLSDRQKNSYKADLFAIVNALVEGNMPVLFNFLLHSDADLIEPVVLANRAFTSLKNIILISQNPGLTAEDCGVSSGQFKFIKYNYLNLNINLAKKKLEFLTNFDLALKTSKLELSKKDMLNYLINNLAYKIN